MKDHKRSWEVCSAGCSDFSLLGALILFIRANEEFMSNLLMISVLLAAVTVSQVVQAAEFEVHPSIALREEFTDNVFVTETGRVSDYITRALPGIVLSYRAPALTGDLNYLFDYRYYARNTHGEEIVHALGAKAKLTAVKNFLFVEVSDVYQRVSLDVTRDVAKESLFVAQGDRNVATVSPFIEFYPTERIMARTGYKFIDTRYFSSAGVDKYDHIAFLNLTYELSNRWSLTADYAFTSETADTDNFDQHHTLGGFRYEYADKSFLFAQAGYCWIRYDSGQSLNNIIWNVGATHVFDTVTGTVTTGVKYNEDPRRNIMQESYVNGILEKRFKRGTLSFSPMYSEYVIPTTDTLLTKKYGAAAHGQYLLTADLNGKLGISAEKYEQRQYNSYTRRFQVESSLSYLLAEQLTMHLSYVYTDYSSPGIPTDNKYINRAMIEIKKIF